jgi:hypothetical protein
VVPRVVEEERQKRIPVERFIAGYEKALEGTTAGKKLAKLKAAEAEGGGAAPKAKTAKKSAKKKAPKKSAKKKAAKKKKPARR